MDRAGKFIVTRAVNSDGNDDHSGEAADSEQEKTSKKERDCSALGQSPRVSSETVHDECNEESSFALLNYSFDTLSDAGGCFGYASEDIVLSPPTTARTQTSRHAKQSPNATREDLAANSFAFPALKSQTRATSPSDFSMGDISPIKFVYSDKTMQQQNESSQIVPTDWTRSEAHSYNHDQRSNPFFVLRSSKRAFDNLKFLLPCLRYTPNSNVHMSHYGSIRQYHEPTPGDDDMKLQDLTIAMRRVDSAICAFGGTVNANRSNQQNRSIFRDKGGSSTARRAYEQRLPSRYVLDGSNVSWEVEESPPVHVSSEVPPPKNQSQNDPSFHKNGTKEVSDQSSVGSGSAAKGKSSGKNAVETSKLKYRCKLCGQIKQNHSCPYQQPLQRSIGVMVYPAVNSYTAAEPGTIAPALTKMNNFISYDSDQGSPKPGYVGQQAIPQGNGDTHPSTITPEHMPLHNSPQSSLSAQSSEDQMHTTNTSHQVTEKADTQGLSTPESHAAWSSLDCRGSIKRSHTEMVGSSGSRHPQSQKQASPPFVSSVSLKPEHYRSVTPGKKAETAEGPTTTSTAYQYPPIPLTFGERKKLSDTLFWLSREIPTVTADSAMILRHARQTGEWDQAVAELLTQIVVGLYCGEGDIRLDGLHRYLLALGISC